jgi:putative redox protein
MIRATSLPVRHQVAFANGAFEAIADVPVEKGGAGAGFGPHELLEAALATCIAMTVEMHADKHGIPLTKATCEVRLDRSNPSAIVLEYALAFEGQITQEQASRLREAATDCPVSRTLKASVAIRPALILR